MNDYIIFGNGYCHGGSAVNCLFDIWVDLLLRVIIRRLETQVNQEYPLR